MKAISLISRRSDLTPAEFRAYYENTHCWLAMQHFPYRRYTRNHVLAASVAVDFDCLSEFAMDPGFDGRAVMQSRSRALLVDDEKEFMDPAQIRVAGAEEIPLHGSPIDGGTRHVLALQRGDLDDGDFRRQVDLLGQKLAHLPDVRHASLDLVHGSGFPFAALIWLTLDGDAPLRLPPGLPLAERTTQLTVATHATPEAVLRQHHVAYLP
ncbi:EthD domain-containing protein [Pseudomonas jinjuensis]|uniref:EthD domain-containing protein n=1 Tax=Pseudomonas jinjuensis TaxID=198616 RepID=A0A1H0R572_9PSED|nr:EthD domain-containing protein [Pseudomonas jinjuensis]SDP24118.1 EthD domain-containing protein [Pseudomonas jinjuensis]